MNNQKSAFSVSSKYVTDKNFRSVFTTWPSCNLFPAYTLSYSAATGKPIENGKKKLYVLLILLLLLITSLAASLILAFLWFSTIQTEYNNESFKDGSNLQPSIFDKDGLIFNNHQSTRNNFKPNQQIDHQSSNQHSIHHTNSHINHQFNKNPYFNNDQPLINQINNSNNNNQVNQLNNQTASTIRTTTTQSTTIEATESNEDDGFGEKENDNNQSNSQQPPELSHSNSDQQPSSNNDEHLINYYKNFKNELDQQKDRTNKIRHEEKLDGEYVEHHTISDIPDDERESSLFLQPQQQVTSANQQNNKPYEQPNLILKDYSNLNSQSYENLYLPEKLASFEAKQFCNLNSYINLFRNSSYECRSDLNPNLISSYFCNDKFVIVAKINALRETVITQQTDLDERQIVNKYDVHIERILKRSPFISVAFKKQGLTTNVTINISILNDESYNSNRNLITCLGRRLELQVGQTYLLSGRIFGLSAVSSNCDVKLEWYNDLDEDQRNQLINWSISRTTFSHC